MRVPSNHHHSLRWVPVVCILVAAASAAFVVAGSSSGNNAESRPVPYNESPVADAGPSDLPPEMLRLMQAARYVLADRLSVTIYDLELVNWESVDRPDTSL